MQLNLGGCYEMCVLPLMKCINIDGEDEGEDEDEGLLCFV
jgi:hypothetical protein